MVRLAFPVLNIQRFRYSSGARDPPMLTNATSRAASRLFSSCSLGKVSLYVFNTILNKHFKEGNASNFAAVTVLAWFLEPHHYNTSSQENSGTSQPR